MIRAWRIDKASRTKRESFSGLGARLTPGRWNSLGTAIVYAASSLSLAALEKFVHLGEDGSAISFSSYAIEIPDSVASIELPATGVPKDWRDVPAPRSTQEIGDAWCAGLRSAVFIVPSTVTKGEWNILLNPAHADFAKIRVADALDYSFDSRMWKAR